MSQLLTPQEAEALRVIGKTMLELSQQVYDFQITLVEIFDQFAKHNPEIFKALEEANGKK